MAGPHLLPDTKMPAASPRWRSSTCFASQARPAGNSADSATPSISRSATSSQNAPAMAVAAATRHHATKLMVIETLDAEAIHQQAGGDLHDGVAPEKDRIQHAAARIAQREELLELGGRQGDRQVGAIDVGDDHAQAEQRD